MSDDIFSENDPAVRRLREAIARKPLPEPVERPEAIDRRSEPVMSRSARVSSLVARIRAGDLSAVDALRALLDLTT